MTTRLEVAGLHAGYGAVAVLHGIDFSVGEGEVTVLLGANGAGKTTVLRALSGLISRHGTIRFEGRAIETFPAEEIVRQGIAHVPEGRGTFGELTVEENLLLGGMTRRDATAVAADLEHMYELFPILKSRRTQQAGTLSGGEQQMLAISRALMLSPRLLLLDEPSFGLAPRVVHEIFGIFTELKTHTGISILLVEQNAGLALELADTVYLLEQGRIAMAGSPALIRNDENIHKVYLGY
jgi:branched-chain amino acid transport system ATP-binding protein